MSTQATVKYSDYLNNKTNEIDIDLLDSATFKGKIMKMNGELGVQLSMQDKILEHLSVEGFMSVDKIVVLNKILVNMYNQIQELKGCE